MTKKKDSFTNYGVKIICLSVILQRFSCLKVCCYAVCAKNNFLRDGNAYDSIDTMISAVSPQLASLLNQTSYEYLKKMGYQKNFIEEFVRAVINCNYGQSLEVSSVFFDTVCFCSVDTSELSGQHEKVVQGWCNMQQFSGFRSDYCYRQLEN